MQRYIKDEYVVSFQTIFVSFRICAAYYFVVPLRRKKRRKGLFPPVPFRPTILQSYNPKIIKSFNPIMEAKKSIEALQFFVTHLAEGAMVHKQQGLMFKSQGFTKLGQKYVDHFGEEMGWVEKFTERILDLGGEVKFEGMQPRELIKNPIEYVKADLAIQGPGVELLLKCMETVKDDPTTYDIMKDYLKDEEEDLYWSQGALDMIECIGAQNWLFTQV